MPQVTLGSPSQGFAISFDVKGDTITASGELSATSNGCGIFGVTYGALLTGTIAADGTFSVSSPPSALSSAAPAINVKGTVPTAAGQPFQGTYTLTASTLSINNGPVCSLNQSGSFTATPVQDVTGTYAGTGGFQVSSGGLGGTTTTQPVTVSMALQQRGTLYGPTGAAGVTSALALSGSLQVSGLACFSSGTTGTTGSSLIEGSRVLVTFTAGDGTRAMVLGSLKDTEARQIGIELIQVTGSQCNAVYDFLPNALIVQR